MRKEPAPWELGILFAALTAIAAWCFGGGEEERPAPVPEAAFTSPDSTLPVKRIGPAAPWQRVSHVDSIYRGLLTPDRYRVARLGENRPGRTGADRIEAEGVYRCVCCGQPLFHSNAKSTSGNGWLSFRRCIGDDESPSALNDRLASMWSEVVCGGCGAHLGHLFPEPASPAGVAYRINTASLDGEGGAPAITRSPGTGGGGSHAAGGDWGMGTEYSDRFGFSLPTGGERDR